MQFYSTNNISVTANFAEATVQGQAPDKGLYFPETLPQLPASFLQNFKSYSKEAIAFEVIAPYVGNTIEAARLKTICAETVDFEIPLQHIQGEIFSLELYHGPTLAFKDIGARFMSRCLSHFVQHFTKKVFVLVATSGDTGGAVANGFYDVDNVEVVILYPKGKVSTVQEKQLTTLGKNITAIEVNGSFDDCQAMVKNAFMDGELTEKLFLTSANSINVARWLPQQFYYFYAMQQWQGEQPPVICVPSGNFGNICAGLLAQASGLQTGHFIAACNANKVVPDFLQNGSYQPQKAIPTISNAMDVGDPSNFVRILKIFNDLLPDLKNKLSAQSISDEDTKLALRQVYEQFHYLLDPHGAVAYQAFANYQKLNAHAAGIILETAHPVKFYDVVEPIIGQTIEVPQSVDAQLKLQKVSIEMEPVYEALRDYLMNR